MERKVLYFTRTGTSQKIAEKIAASISSEAGKISDGKDWSGPIGYMSAGRFTMTNQKASITVPDNFLNADEYIVVTPLWCGKVAPAVSALFDKIPKEKTHLVVSSNGSKLKNRDGFLSVTDIVKHGGDKNNEEIIEVFVKNLS